MFTRATPAPNRAPIPTAPVIMGIAPALEVLVDAVALAAPPPMEEVAVATPEVNGAVDTLDAPEKAGAPVLAVVFAAFVSLGLRTLSMTCTTPPAIKTLGVTTLAPLTNRVPLAPAWTVSLAPLTVP